VDTFITIVIMLSLLAFYLVWQRANTLNARHRADTWSLLTYIGTLGGPNFEANKAAKWQG
jgi:hypothetical protein